MSAGGKRARCRGQAQDTSGGGCRRNEREGSSPAHGIKPTPFPSLDTISYFRKTCLSISSDMVLAFHEGSQAPLLWARSHLSTELTS